MVHTIEINKKINQVNKPFNICQKKGQLNYTQNLEHKIGGVVHKHPFLFYSSIGTTLISSKFISALTILILSLSPKE